jgi:hypothetical protein
MAQTLLNPRSAKRDAPGRPGKDPHDPTSSELQAGPRRVVSRAGRIPRADCVDNGVDGAVYPHCGLSLRLPNGVASARILLRRIQHLGHFRAGRR